MKVIIELPGIKAISRNQTTGHYYNYKERLNEAEAWAVVFGKSKEYHFTKRVDVYIDVYIDTVHPYKVVTKSGKTRMEYAEAIDSPNVDDKIFTDILNRYKRQKNGPPIERRVWWIEDDSPTYLRRVVKETIRSDHFKVVITIEEVEGSHTLISKDPVAK